MLFVFIYTYWCPTRFPYQMIFVSSNSHTTGVTCGAGPANPSGAPGRTLVFSGVPPARSLVFLVMFCRSLSCPFSFGHRIFCPSIYGFWISLCYLLNTPLVSSEYPFGIFWISLWNLLNTPLVSSEYPFVIFWIPLWYLLNTPLVSSEYPFGIFWISFWNLLNTPLISSEYPFVIFWTPLWYLLNTPLVSSEYPFVIFWIPLCYLLNTPLLSSNFSCLHSFLMSSP